MFEAHAPNGEDITYDNAEVIQCYYLFLSLNLLVISLCFAHAHACSVLVRYFRLLSFSCVYVRESERQKDQSKEIYIVPCRYSIRA